MKENSIEEDIKILERVDIKFFISSMVEQSDYIIDKADEVNNAIEHILSDYKRVLKENEELKKFITEGITIEPNSPYKNYQLDFLRKNYIPIQKVKDKISERQFELQQEYKDFEDDAILTVLQELIEGR